MKDFCIMYVGMMVGVFCFDDGGWNWCWVFFEIFCVVNNVLGIMIDFNDFDCVIFGMGDGVF